jgi:hypothetical protein
MLYLISKELHTHRWAVVVRPLAKCIAVVDPTPGVDGYVVCDHGSGPQRFSISIQSIVAEKNFQTAYAEIEEWCDEDNLELERIRLELDGKEAKDGQAAPE